MGDQLLVIIRGHWIRARTTTAGMERRVAAAAYSIRASIRSLARQGSRRYIMRSLSKSWIKLLWMQDFHKAVLIMMMPP